MTLRLADLEKPLDDVEFPNGAKHQPVPFGPTEYKLWRDIQSETDAMARGTMLLQIVRACYPNATDDDWDSCTPTMLIALAAHAGRKIDQVRDALKNVAAVEAQEAATEAAPTPPSSPTTNGITSARKPRKRKAATSGTSTSAAPTDVPSSSGTPITDSTSHSGSTPYAVKWTTSTEPSSSRVP